MAGIASLRGKRATGLTYDLPILSQESGNNQAREEVNSVQVTARRGGVWSRSLGISRTSMGVWVCSR
jgi:hypothetical protein